MHSADLERLVYGCERQAVLPERRTAEDRLDVIDGNTYYLDTETGYAATGITTLVPNGATEEARCVFDANGVFQSNVTGVYSVGNDTYWLNSGIIEEEAA